jgi:type I restriction enzyme S subunit
LTLTAVTQGDFEGNIKITTANEAKVADMWLQPGDLFIQRSNTPHLVGTARLYQGRPNLAIFPDLLIRIRLHRSLEPKYVELFLQSEDARAYFRRSAQGIAGSMPKISQGVVGDARVPIPPRSEQDRIVSILDTEISRIDAAIEGLKRVQANLKRYRASVLKAAVEGRLVPTEAELARQEGRDYEPASVLLAGILAERRRRWEEAELAKMKAKGKTPKNDKWKAKYKEPAAPDTDGLPELPEGWCWARSPWKKPQARERRAPDRERTSALVRAPRPPAHRAVRPRPRAAEGA